MIETYKRILSTYKTYYYFICIFILPKPASNFLYLPPEKITGPDDPYYNYLGDYQLTPQHITHH